MNKTTILVFALLIARLTSLAQLADGSTAPDFTLTDINGVEFNLYDALDEGKTVFVNFSAAWSEPAWNYHISGKLQEVNSKCGPDGYCSNDVIVVCIESDPTTLIDDLNGTGNNTQGDWISNSTFPIFNPSNTDVLDSYQVNYFPTVFRICPNKITRLNNQLGAEAHLATIGTCGLANDLEITNQRDYLICSPEFTPSVLLSNINKANAGSLTVHCSVDGGNELGYEWSENLPVGDSVWLNFPTQTLESGMHMVEYSLVSTDSVGDGNGTNNCIQQYFTIVTNSPTSIPFLQDMSDANFPYLNWSIDNEDMSNTWKRTGIHNGALTMDFYNYAETGETDGVVLEPLNFSSLQNPKLAFSVAYAMYNSESYDGLGVMVSVDCGNTWTEVYFKEGTELTTADSTTSFFIPGDTDWRSECVDLSQFAGNAKVFIAFVGYNGFGNNLYIDNFNVGAECVVGMSESVTQVAAMSLFPNPANDRVIMRYNVLSSENLSLEVVDVFGNIVVARKLGNLSPGQHQTELVISDLASGMYFVKLSEGKNNWIEKLLVK